MIVPNTNSQTIHQMGLAINAVVRQATGRDAVQNIDMDWVTVAQNKTVQVFSESVPYIFRRTGGGMNIGNARLSSSKVIGGTVAFNQLADFTGSASQEFSDGANYYGTFTERLTKNIKTVANHKYFVSIKVNRTISENDAVYIFIGGNSGITYTPCVICNNGDSNGYFYGLINASTVIDSDAIGYNNYAGKRGFSSGDSITVSDLVVIDLTQMFGSTIADYIYSLETANAGDGVAWFRKYFPDAYYDYNAGELMSVSGLVSHDMTGFNQWDEQWEVGYIDGSTGENTPNANAIRSKNFCRCVGSTVYAGSFGSFDFNKALYIMWYDADKAFIIRSVWVSNTHSFGESPANACYFRIAVYNYNSAYKNDICINFSNPNLNGRYEPYHLYSYPLDSDLVLRGIPKLDTDNNLYYDGDIYEHDGKVTRKYEIVDLGTLTYITSPSHLFTSNSLTAVVKKGHISAALSHSIISAIYTEIDSNSITGPNSTNPSPNMTMALSSAGVLYFNNTSYNSIEDFKAAMSGVMLVYELATPTTDTADPFTDPQEVSPYGTEEYISTGIVPVGNETQYLELSDTNM